MFDPLDPIRRDLERIGKVVKGIWPPTTTICPLCFEVIEIPEYNSISRTDALKAHLNREHGLGRL